MRKKDMTLDEDKELFDKDEELSDEDLGAENYTNGIFNFPELLNIINVLTPSIINAVNQNNLTTLKSLQERYNDYVADHYADNEHYNFTPTFSDITTQDMPIVDYALSLGHYYIVDCLKWGLYTDANF